MKNDSRKNKQDRTTARNAKVGREVQQHLDSHKEIDTSAIDISVSKKTVRLTGQVDNAHAKNLATSIASQEIAEVDEVINDDLNYKRDNSQAPAEE